MLRLRDAAAAAAAVRCPVRLGLLFFPLSIYLLIIFFFFCVRSLATPAALLSVFFTWFSAWGFIKKIIYKEKRSRSVCIYLLEPVRNARLSLRIFQFPTWDIYRIFFWNSTQRNTTHTHRHEEFCKLRYTKNKKKTVASAETFKKDRPKAMNNK